MWIVVCYRWVWRVPSYLPWVVWVVQWRDQCPAGSGATYGSAFSADLRLLAQRQARLCRVAGDWTLRQLAGAWGRPWLPRRNLASSVSRQRSQLRRYWVSQQAWYQGMTIDVSKPKLLSLFITIYFSLYYSYILSTRWCQTSFTNKNCCIVIYLWCLMAGYYTSLHKRCSSIV